MKMATCSQLHSLAVRGFKWGQGQMSLFANRQRAAVKLTSDSELQGLMWFTATRPTCRVLRSQMRS